MSLWTDQGAGWRTASFARVHTENDAYLCCPGPSLADAPAELRGAGRTIFAINTAYPRVKPDFWLGTDRIACFDRGLWREAFPKITRLIRGDNDVDAIRLCPQVYYADIDEIDERNMLFRRDHDVRFVWPTNTLMFALHFAIWTGHKRVHLFGCDMGGSRDYYDARELAPAERRQNRHLYASQVTALARLTPLAAAHGITLLSCTPGSPLNAFMSFAPLEASLALSSASVPDGSAPIHSMAAEA